MKRSFSFILCVAVIISSFWSENSCAQDAEFSQFYAAPLHLNPSMVGFTEQPRVSLNFRDQGVAFNNAYITMSLAYDQHFSRYRSSVGGAVFADVAGGLYNTYQVSGFYAYRLPLTEYMNLQTGIQLAYMQRNINEGELLYYDMIDPQNPNSSLPGNEMPLVDNTLHRFDVGAGAVLYEEDFYVGVSAKHLTTPSFSFTGTDDANNRLLMRFSIHGGKTFYLTPSKPGDDRRWYVVPNFLLASQGNFVQINAGAYTGKGKLFGGMWLRHVLQNTDSFIVSLGWRSGIFRAGYSYDFTVSQIKKQAGAHEISLTIDWGQDEYYKKRNRLRGGASCPTMFK